MKKFILIALFALVMLQVKAQSTTCFNAERVELKTWSHTYQKYFVTESVSRWGIAQFCTYDKVVSFTFNGETSTYVTKTKTEDYYQDDVHHTTWSLYGGGYVLMSFKTTEPNFLVVSLMIGDNAITYQIPEQ